MKAFFPASAAAGRSNQKPIEQIAGHPDQFPENEQLQKVVRQHNTQHREGEQAQTREVASEPAVLTHVTPGINVNRAGHAGDDKQHQQAHRVKPHAKIHPQVTDRKPGNGGLPHRSPVVQFDENQAQDEPGDHCPDGKARAELAVVLRKQRDQRRRQQREE